MVMKTNTNIRTEIGGDVCVSHPWYKLLTYYTETGIDSPRALWEKTSKDSGYRNLVSISFIFTC